MFVNRGMDKEDVVHVYNGILLSCSISATSVDLEIAILRKVSQTEKEKYLMISLTYGN